MTTATEVRPAPPAAAPRPVSAIRFRTLLAVEFRKAVDTRAARWLLTLTAAVTVLVMLAPLLARHSIDQTWSSYLGYPTIAATTLLPVVCILMLTSEWGQRSVLTTFTQEPRRHRVISAKVGVSACLALVAAASGLLVTVAAVGIAAASGGHVEFDLGAANTLGFVAFVLLNVMMGVAFGALLHNTAAAIVLFFLLPTAFGFLGAAVKAVAHWIDPSTVFGWVLAGHYGGHVPQMVVATLLWVIAPLTAGLVRTARREIA